jgi:hypothetical protein
MTALFDETKSGLHPTAYITPELHENAEGNVTIESGGYFMLGDICVLNCRIKATSQILESGIFANLPVPLSASGLADGSSVVAVTNHKGLSLTITNKRQLVVAASDLPIAADTVVVMSAIYPCVPQNGGTS